MMNLEQKISEVSEKMDVYPMVNNASMYNYYRGKFDAYIDCRQLKQENEQLRAHVDNLMKHLEYTVTVEMCADETGYIQDVGFVDRELTFERAAEVLMTTPAQSLQQIKRDAANQAFDMMVEATNKAFMPHIEGVRAVFLNNLVKDGE